MSTSAIRTTELVFFLVTAVWRTTATAGDASNAAEFTVLCTLDQFASTDLSTTYKAIDLPTPAVAAIDEIVAAATSQANISAVPDAITKPEGDAATDSCQTAGEDKAACRAHWRKWLKIKKDLKAKGKNCQYQPLSIAKRENPAAAQYQLELTRIAKAAHDKANKAKNIAENELKAATNDATKHIRNARLGSSKTAFNKVTANTAHMTSDRTTSCKSPNSGKSLAHDMMCLCAEDNSGSAKFCGFEVKGCHGGTWQACSDVQQNEAYTAITTECNKHPRRPCTPDSIQQALGAFLAKIKSAAGADPTNRAAVFLGTPDTNECKASANSLCVDYSTQAQADGGLQGFYRLKEMLAAAEKIKEVEQAINQISKLETELINLEDRAALLYSLIASAATPAQPQEAANTEPKAQRSSTDGCKSPAETADQCPSASCIYNTTTKECKPKPGTENTAAGTGEAATEEEATTGCARDGTDRTACENDKTGDKQNCAWRKGKDNEDNKNKGK
uniref:Variant surface glycoprotein 1030 n=1 Tax=Trypanosoma brucei TaxID=5691 RepID=M4SUF3_9TRYP|nr:variant surface glycoprotein 1030 [Trypanosoma brucei]